MNGVDIIVQVLPLKAVDQAAEQDRLVEAYNKKLPLLWQML